MWKRSSFLLKKPIHIFLLGLSISSCTSIKQVAIEKDVNQLLSKSAVFSDQFTGFCIYDIESDVIAALPGAGFTRSDYDRLFIFAPLGSTKAGKTNWTAYGYYNWDKTVYSHS